MEKLRSAIRRFMMGRYGTDKLNIAILVVGVVVCMVGMYLPAVLGLLCTALSYGLMILAIYRCFSRNTYQRYRENSRYLRFVEQLKDRQHRYYSCPRCRQSVRVPRGKGKIAITCPKCQEKFIRKS